METAAAHVHHVGHHVHIAAVGKDAFLSVTNVEAVYVGNKVAGPIGAAVALAGTVVPSILPATIRNIIVTIMTAAFQVRLFEKYILRILNTA